MRTPIVKTVIGNIHVPSYEWGKYCGMEEAKELLAEALREVDLQGDESRIRLYHQLEKRGLMTYPSTEVAGAMSPPEEAK